jgi:hypothetical protein
VKLMQSADVQFFGAIQFYQQKYVQLC